MMSNNWTCQGCNRAFCNKSSADVITVPDCMTPVLIHLRHFLEIYKDVRKSETVLIDLLTKEIERVREEGQGDFYIETLISEYKYPRFFDEEEQENTFDVDPFTFNNSRRNH